MNKDGMQPSLLKENVGEDRWTGYQPLTYFVKTMEEKIAEMDIPAINLLLKCI